jgi:hypothetical protein
MRVIHAAALTAAALLLTSVASAQGLGDAAAAARQKRKAEPSKPTKVYTEGDIGQTMAPVSTPRDLPATNTPATAGELPATGGLPAGEGQPLAEGQPAVEGQAPAEGSAADAKAAEDLAAAEAEAQARAVEDWRKRLDQARKEEAIYKDVIGKVEVQVGGTGGLYSPGRTANLALLEESKQKLAETQAKIAALEDEGRRNSYR